MSSPIGKLLVVDDDPDTLAVLRMALEAAGHRCDVCQSSEEALSYLLHDYADVVITDIQMAAMDGLALCSALSSAHPDTSTIVMTGHGTVDVAIQAIRAGAYDFVTKPISLEDLELAIGRALAFQALRGEARRLRGQLETGPLPGIVGASPAIRQLNSMIRQMANSDATVLITGESGTGKELVARALHERSRRAEQPFVAVNCAAMPAALLESELFGHAKGAFTDAREARTGLFLRAGSGTIFLDEIGEMPQEMQAKLLRALQERTVRPVGGDREVRYEARLIAATNRDLEHDVEEGRFREDLFYRINVVHLAVPPLRARQGDILALAQHFMSSAARRYGKQIDGVDPEVEQKLLAYNWPGNVRELENCMERAIALTPAGEVGVGALPEKVRDYRSAQIVLDVSGPSELVTLGEMERRYVRHALTACHGNKTHAARVLGIDRRSLYRRLPDL